MRWSPHVTVATILERDQKFLFVEELIEGRNVLNQPAGHWEKNETLIEASVRETLEETAWQYQPESLVGIYEWQHPHNHETFLRFCFTGKLIKHEPNRELDKEIIRTVWLSRDEVIDRNKDHRSPLVQTCLDDYCTGQRHELTFLKTID